MNKDHPFTREEFDWVYGKVPGLSVDIMCETDEGLLLTKRTIEPGKGMWHLPGGRVLFGESLTGAARRIALKELGLSVHDVEYVGVMECLFESRHDVALVFTATLEEGEIVLDESATEFGFFKELPEEMIWCQKEFLENRGR